ncbi:MAG: phosphatidylserine/phosphatidylglycerophosphate/cardiolipin synthase family protein [Gammaproteobacteria bacterium]|nr:phosphatidylserine/phosphatidylglycerophosphate/cardiolipin synthase family protein [Gammaproteobacteria bacterium]NIR97464.1 phosphatidylserine/phosphatidylglycerophosphate/cardiolipin synthase family protein [Gammaproteobacteria bacterium]NIT63089.1 phosphatidylserine/phosphatidylglycerophosphate/cardiolipin synthase family protein [Gammaproteobacteria bacterium]NIV20051.1 phosphatidylserine/phosphatidylglycerophosphate/cardiolipin synthase family protein [Gammaproteobacteria bacterium]NIX
MNRRQPLRPKYRFPWRSGNKFRLLVDGERFFEAMLGRIDSAERYVLLEMYLFESGRVADRFIAAFLRARGRGVSVYLLLDAYGAQGLRGADRDRLVEAGVELALYNPLRLGRLRSNLFRDHRKLLLIDGEVAFTGGMGIVDAFAPGPGPMDHWHEVAIEIRGPNVLDWQSLFEETWSRAGLDRLQLEPGQVPRRAGERSGRVVVSRATAQSEIARSYVKRIGNAKHRVWLATAYFVPSWKLRRALRKGVHRGADVRIMLPGPLTDHPWARHVARRYYERLLRNGIRIFELQPRFLHAKMLLCDTWVSVGSSNVDRWNLAWNLEANQEVHDRGLAEQAEAVFADDFPQCEEIDYERWRRRPWYSQLREWFWGNVAALLRWLSLRRGQRRR